MKTDGPLAKVSLSVSVADIELAPNSLEPSYGYGKGPGTGSKPLLTGGQSPLVHLSAFCAHTQKMHIESGSEYIPMVHSLGNIDAHTDEYTFHPPTVMHAQGGVKFLPVSVDPDTGTHLHMRKFPNASNGSIGRDDTLLVCGLS